jgi:uncharacterized membrane protein YwaF
MVGCAFHEFAPIKGQVKTFPNHIFPLMWIVIAIGMAQDSRVFFEKFFFCGLSNGFQHILASTLEDVCSGQMCPLFRMLSSTFLPMVPNILIPIQGVEKIIMYDLVYNS